METTNFEAFLGVKSSRWANRLFCAIGLNRCPSIKTRSREYLKPDKVNKLIDVAAVWGCWDVRLHLDVCEKVLAK